MSGLRIHVTLRAVLFMTFGRLCNVTLGFRNASEVILMLFKQVSWWCRFLNAVISYVCILLGL